MRVSMREANQGAVRGAKSMNAIKGLEELNVVRLKDALLCANCELIVNETLHGACPACNSNALMSLARLLGGTIENQPEPCLLPGLEGGSSRGLETLPF
jgi:hypothetical protein